jgi:hypothetical protein
MMERMTPTKIYYKHFYINVIMYLEYNNMTIKIKK